VGAGVENPGVIDLVTEDPRSGEFAVIMVESRPWRGREQRLAEVQAKTNAYLRFILDGQMRRLYPDSKGRPVRIQLDCVEAPDRDTAEFLEDLAKRVEEYAVRFVVNVLRH